MAFVLFVCTMIALDGWDTYRHDRLEDERLDVEELRLDIEERRLRIQLQRLDAERQAAAPPAVDMGFPTGLWSLSGLERGIDNAMFG